MDGELFKEKFALYHIFKRVMRMTVVPASMISIGTYAA